MNKNKTIWIINQYITTPKLSNKTHRHFGLGKGLVKDNNVFLFTGSFSHLHENEFEDDVIAEEGLHTVNLSLMRYKGMITRVLNFFHFVLKLRFFDYRKVVKPDVIIISTMSLFPLLLIKFYKRKFPGVKVVHEVRDIWPLTPIVMGGYSARHPFIKLLAYCEKMGYNNADHFVSNLSNAGEYIYSVVPERKEVPFTWISNGYDANGEVSELEDHIIEKLPKNKFLVGYAGSIGKANCMEIVIKAFNILNDRKDNALHLCVVGGGEMENFLKDLSSENVTFLGKIPKRQVDSFLNRMDVCILSWMKTNLYYWGISPNKIFDYLNASKPIIMCGDIKNSIIEEANCGWVLPAENIEALVANLEKVAMLSEKELTEIGDRGKKFLEEHFYYDHLANRYQKEVIDVL